MQQTHVWTAAAAIVFGLTGAAAAEGMTEGQARHAIWGKCNNPSNLTRDASGNWHGYCSSGPIMVSTTGVVSADAAGMPAGTIGESQARSILGAQCPGGASTLHADSQGNWHGYCGGKALMVDKTGAVSPDAGGVANGLTEAHARSIAWGSCANVSALHTDAQGNWRGYCSKGPLTIDPTGKISFN